jgi:hypothetical protein
MIPLIKQDTIRSAGYNIWYSRDEFRYIWKKYNGDASLAAQEKAQLISLQLHLQGKRDVEPAVQLHSKRELPLSRSENWGTNAGRSRGR